MRINLFPYTIKRFLAITIFTIVIKGGIVAYLLPKIQQDNPNVSIGNISLKCGDSYSYISSIENFISYNQYFFYDFDGKEGFTEKVYAGRMPHYGAIYYFFRLFSNQNTACDLMVLLQLIVECISISCLAYCAYFICKTNRAFYFTWAIAVLSLNSTILALYVIPESFSLNFLYIFLFLYFKFNAKNQISTYKALIILGLLISIITIMRPHLILLFIPIIGILFFELVFRKHQGFNTWILFIKKTTILCLPLIIFLGPWTIRNFLITKKFIPLQMVSSGYFYAKSDFAIRSFIAAWGGDFVYWDNQSAGCYFDKRPEIDCNFVFPKRALSKSITLKEMDYIRMRFAQIRNNYGDSLDIVVSNEINYFKKVYISERPFFYIASPLYICGKFLIHKGSYFISITTEKPFDLNDIFVLLIKGIQVIIYWITLVLGMVGVVLLFRKNKTYNFILLFIPIMLIVVIAIVFRSTEYRYFSHSFPALLIGTIYIVEKLFSTQKWIKK